jgi:hypothetical protein
MLRAETRVDSPEKNGSIREDLSRQGDAPGNPGIPVGHSRGKAYQVWSRVFFQSLHVLFFRKAEVVIIARNLPVAERFLYLPATGTYSSPGEIFFLGFLNAIQEKNPVSPLPESLKKIEKTQGLGPEIEKSEILYRGVYPQYRGMPKVFKMYRVIRQGGASFFL